MSAKADLLTSLLMEGTEARRVKHGAGPGRPGSSLRYESGERGAGTMGDIMSLAVTTFIFTSVKRKGRVLSADPSSALVCGYSSSPLLPSRSFPTFL